MTQIDTRWPFGDGEMAGRIRDFDWSATPLGPIADWTERLRLAVELMLASPLVSSLACGPQRLLLYNAAAARHFGDHHPAALGRPLPETFPEGWATVAPYYARAFDGETVKVGGHPLDTRGEGVATDVFDALLAPVRERDGSIAYVQMTGAEVGDRARIEAALRESETRHRLLIESWAQAVWETDAHGVVVADSPSWRAYTGQTVEEWLGYGWLNAIHPDDRAFAEGQWRAAIAAHRLVNADFRLRAADGGWRWTNVRAAPVRHAGGKIERWVGMNIDIDARKGAEAALRESEERYRFLFEAMDEAYAVVEVIKDEDTNWVDFRFLDANPAFVKHTSMPYPVGKTATELLGSPNPRWTELYGQALDTGEPIRIEETEHTLGRTFDLNIFTMDRARNQVAVLFTNITARKTAEAALRESEERLRGFGDASQDVLWIRDAETLQWVYLTPAFEETYGLDRAAALADDNMTGWLHLILAEDRQTVLDTIRKVRGGERVSFEYRVRRPSDGAVRWLRNTDFPIHDAAGRVRWIGGVGRDITDEKAATRRQEVLVNELQHRARNLLGVVTAVAGRTLREGGSVDAFEERLQALSRAQALLSQAGSDTVEVGALVRAELAAHTQNGSDRVRVGGPVVQLTARQVQNFALALHELTTNAVKYGALKDGAGRLVVTWEVVRDGRALRRLALSWVESGVSVQQTTEARRGYGTELIQEALAYALEAEIDYVLGADGVRCRIELPIA